MSIDKELKSRLSTLKRSRRFVRWGESAGLARPLTASLLYRALLDSILRRARTTTYGHGARYLRKLDLLAKTVNDWGDIEPHRVYVEQLRHKHGRKTSFWSRYDR